MFRSLQSTWRDYPPQFWVLFAGTLVNAIGNGLIGPFFSLYFTRRLNFSMTEVGVVFALWAAISVIGQIGGGVLVDRVGRRPVMLVGTFSGALAMAFMGLAGALAAQPGVARWLYVTLVNLLFGIGGAASGPALQAMVADLVQGERRAQAYGLMRVIANLGVAIGPAIGGFVATRSYEALFVIAALTTVAFGVLVALRIEETRPASAPAAAGAPVAPRDGLGGLLVIARDRPFLLFSGLYLIAQIVYSQMNTSLPVYLNLAHGVSEEWYGLLMSLNAAMVVLFQFPITRWTDRFPRARIMALGMACYAVGFGMFGVVGALPLFFLAQAIWTAGEMLSVPVSQAFVADIAPEDMRGRYMSAYGLTMTTGYGLGPLLGGAVMDTYGGRYIWYGAFALNALTTAGYLALERLLPQRPAPSRT